MRDAIHALKYEGVYPVSRRLGTMLAEAISRLAAEAPPEMLVIPVPLHPSKYSQRGFNQARLLAARAVAVLRRTHPQWRLRLARRTVVRQRATESQAGLTSRQRRINVRGAFAVSDPRAVARKHILVIDDILTTGATARAVAQVLMRAGASRVWIATLARARRWSDDGSLIDPLDSGKDFNGKAERGDPAEVAGFGLEDVHAESSQPSS